MSKVSNNVREFLLSFFEEKEGNESIEIGDFVLMKYKLNDHRGNFIRWNVSVYTKESFKRYELFGGGYLRSKEFQEQDDHIKRINGFW